MLSFDESDFLDDDSDNDGSDSGSYGRCAFTFRFEYPVGCVGDSVGRVDGSIGRVCDEGSGVFVRTVIESIGDVVPLVAFLPI